MNKKQRKATAEIVNSPFGDILGWKKNGDLTPAGRDVVRKKRR